MVLQAAQCGGTEVVRRLRRKIQLSLLHVCIFLPGLKAYSRDLGGTVDSRGVRVKTSCRGSSVASARSNSHQKY